MKTELLDAMLEQGYVYKNKHPHADLFIFNYTAMAQYDRVWNDVTLQCRGLILDAEYNIVARPFPKFFNLSEHDPSEIPNLPFKVYDKLDGSLGILYFLNGEPKMATRGSFDSIQAHKANEILYKKYASIFSQLNQEHTYLFEIIYPENRIVVNYGDLEDLILIEIIETQTGRDVPLSDLGFPTVKCFDQWHDLSEMRDLNIENKEGFVLKFDNGFRVKIKFDDYVRLHRIVTQCSSIDIWECLQNETSFAQFLNDVPDEFYNWVKATEKDLKAKYKAIEDDCKAYFKTCDTRKETAEYFLKHPHSGVLFNMLSGKDYSKAIWKKIKPAFEKPFTNRKDD